MKIGINRWTLPPALTLSESFRLAMRAGFDSIEINIAEDGELTLDSDEPSVRALVADAKDAGIELSSLSTGLGWKYPLGSMDPAIREKARAVVRKSLQVASWMDVDTILVVPGVVTPDAAYDQVYNHALEGVRSVAPDAERLGVTIGIENVWNKFLLSPLEFARFIDEAGSEAVGAYFDAGNILQYGYPDQWIRILGSRIKKVHVKDFKANIGNGTGFCNPLQGDVPWEKVRAALAEIGYDEYVTGEVAGYKVHPEIGLKHIAESLRAVFAG
ncbi:MAG TPA: sugar phosphate isomerase/epimerase family protein [Chthonomonadaceae bacterium]|nr:sugar phosphate isomerase/epimerase family protein [Chthonomonadaceae bacterium]